MAGVDPFVVHDDIALFLTGWYRTAIAAIDDPVCADVDVADQEPPVGQSFAGKLVVIRADGGDDTWFLTGERDVGVSVLVKGTKEDASKLARIVHGLRTQIPSADPQNPVAAVVASQMPVDVQESQPHHRWYFPMTLAVVARSL